MMKTTQNSLATEPRKPQQLQNYKWIATPWQPPTTP